KRVAFTAASAFARISSIFIGDLNRTARAAIHVVDRRTSGARLLVDPVRAPIRLVQLLDQVLGLNPSLPGLVLVVHDTPQGPHQKCDVTWPTPDFLVPNGAAGSNEPNVVRQRRSGGCVVRHDFLGELDERTEPNA